ncbi:MAG: 2Fe-2S iron-sulfur cluster-binding protein, partial [Pseudomonadota bacterium]
MSQPAASVDRPPMSVSVWRGGPDGGDFEDFEVPRHESQTVLDVVAWIQQEADPTLSYRFACRVGMCGSCAMMVNGVPRWTCRTHVQKVLEDNRAGGQMRIAPLRNLPVIKDLAADMDPFFEKWVGAEGVFHPTATRHDAVAPISPDLSERQAADAGIECINCSVCYAAWRSDRSGEIGATSSSRVAVGWNTPSAPTHFS